MGSILSRYRGDFFSYADKNIKDLFIENRLEILEIANPSNLGDEKPWYLVYGVLKTGENAVGLWYRSHRSGKGMRPTTPEENLISVDDSESRDFCFKLQRDPGILPYESFWYVNKGYNVPNDREEYKLWFKVEVAEGTMDQVIVRCVDVNQEHCPVCTLGANKVYL